MFPKEVDFDSEIESIKEEDGFIYNMIGFQYDFKSQELILKDGNPVILEGREAVQQWIEKNLLTKLHAYEIYIGSPDMREYGSSLFDILKGRKYPRIMTLAEAERDVREMCAENPYIQNIQNFEIMQEGVKGVVSFDVILVNHEVITITEEVNVL